ncbi:MAG: MATE family efflux transporter [Thomasclavelia sp.]|jgi:putative MATE family efflux protein|nr:MATE family efflux transporter [Thomasclavelia sp.]
MKKMNVDLLHGNILKGILIFALPLLFSNIFQQLYNTADTMIVGNALGDVSLAAIGAATPVFELLVGFALGVGNGLSIVTARSYGSGDESLIKKSVASSIVIGFILSIVIALLGQVFLYPLLQLLNTPSNIINEAYSYISLVTLFVIVMFSYNLCAGLLRAIGNSIMPLVFLIISSLMNIGLDLFFIVFMGLGIKGAAIGTVISQLFSTILCLIYIKTRCPILVPTAKDFTLDKELYKELAGQGFSMGFMMSIVSSGTVILQSAINGLGYLTIAGHTAARKIQAFGTMPVATIALSMMTFVSQNKGANNRERIKIGIKYAFYISIAWGIIATILALLFARPLVSLISGSSENVVIDNGSLYLKINAPFYAILGILLVLRNSLQGLGRKIMPLVSSIIELVGKIVFVILFIPSLKYFGVIICEPIIWCLMCTQLAYAFYTNPYIRGD